MALNDKEGFINLEIKTHSLNILSINKLAKFLAEFSFNIKSLPWKCHLSESVSTVHPLEQTGFKPVLCEVIDMNKAAPVLSLDWN